MGKIAYCSSIRVTITQRLGDGTLYNNGNPIVIDLKELYDASQRANDDNVVNPAAGAGANANPAAGAGVGANPAAGAGANPAAGANANPAAGAGANANLPDVATCIRNIDQQKNFIKTGLSKTNSGVSIDFDISGHDPFITYYVPIVEKEKNFDNVQDILKGDLGAMTSKAKLTSGETLINYNKSLGTNENNSDLDISFESTNNQIFDRANNSPLLDYPAGANLGAGFKSAGITGFKKIELLPGKNPPSTSEYYWFAVNKGSITDPTELGLIKANERFPWSSMKKQNPDPANPGLIEDPTHKIMRLSTKEGAFKKKASSFPAWLASTLGGSLAGAAAGAALGALAAMAFSKGGADPYTIPMQFYVLDESFFNGHKFQEYANFSANYTDWKAKWAQTAGATNLFFAAKKEEDVKIGSAGYSFRTYVKNGISYDFDGKWSLLPAPPEFCGYYGSVCYADSYFGRINFENAKTYPLKVTDNSSPDNKNDKISWLDASGIKNDIAKTLPSLAGKDWLDKLKQSGQKTYNLLDRSSKGFDSSDNIVRVYAMYSVKVLVGYYTYDFSMLKWLAIDEFWVTPGQTLPKPSHSLPVDTSAYGDATQKFMGTWMSSDVPPSSYSVDSAKEIDPEDPQKKRSGLSTDALSKEPAVLMPRFFYSMYKAKGIKFIWYVYEFKEKENGEKEGKWVKYYSSKDVAITGQDIPADSGFVDKFNSDNSGDNKTLDLLNGRYKFTGKWFEANSGVQIPDTVILKSDDQRSDGVIHTFDDFSNGSVVAKAGSTQATYTFYAIYDQVKSFKVEYYVLSNGDSLNWEKLSAGDDDKWEGLVENQSDTTAKVTLPNSKDFIDNHSKISLTGNAAKGDYEFSYVWRVGKESDLKEGSLSFKKSGLGYEITKEIAQGFNAVSGEVKSDDENTKNLTIALNEKGETVYKLYAVYDKLYKVEFNLLGGNSVFPTSGNVAWNTIFTANIRAGETLSSDNTKNSEGKTLLNVLGAIELTSTMLKPVWKLKSGNYDFAGSWINADPNDPYDNFSEPGCANDKLFVKSKVADYKIIFESSWNLATSSFEDKFGFSTKKAAVFDPSNSDSFHIDENGVARFYGLYVLKGKNYAVEYYVPKVSDGKITWEQLDPDNENWKGVADFSVDTVDIPLPTIEGDNAQMKDCLNFEVSNGENKGKYSFANCWINAPVSENDTDEQKSKGPENWNKPDGVRAGRELQFELKVRVDAVSGDVSSSENLSVDIAGDAGITYRLYAVYDLVYQVEFYLISQSYETKPTGEVQWTNILTSQIKSGEMMQIDNLKGLDGDSKDKTVKEVIAKMASDAQSNKTVNPSLNPVWGLTGGKTFDLSNFWFNPANAEESATKINIANSKCFIPDDSITDLSYSWTLTDKDDDKYKAKKGEKFVSSENKFFVEDGIIKFYAIYIPTDVAEFVFYVVNSFENVNFEWQPYSFKCLDEDTEMQIHKIPVGKVIPDANSILKINTISSGSPFEAKRREDVQARGALEGNGFVYPNNLIFKGWRRLDDSELDQSKYEKYKKKEKVNGSVVTALDLVNPSNDANNIFYKCACLKEYEKKDVQKADYFCADGAWKGIEIKNEDLPKAFIFVAVYEYQTVLSSFTVLDPLGDYDFTYYRTGIVNYADNNKNGVTILVSGSCTLSAGSKWPIRAKKYRYFYSPVTKRMGKVLGSDGVEMFTPDPNREGEKWGFLDSDASFVIADGVDIFNGSGFQVVVWWITNPSGYTFCVGLGTGIEGTYTISDQPGNAGQFVAAEDGSSGSSTKRRRL